MNKICLLFILHVLSYDITAQRTFPDNGTLYEKEDFYRALLNGDSVKIDDSFQFYFQTLIFFQKNELTYRLCDFIGKHEKSYENIAQPSSVSSNGSFFFPTDALLIFPFFFDFYFFRTDQFTFKSKYQRIGLLQISTGKKIYFGDHLKYRKATERIVKKLLMLSKSKDVMFRLSKQRISPLEYLGYKWQFEPF